MEKLLKYILFFSMPASVRAQQLDLPNSTVTDIINYIIALLSILNPILFSLAFIVFFWGLSKYILNSGSKDEIEKGRNYMLWGILVLFILVSFRVIISFISSDLGLGGANNIPTIPNA